jgi:hypothetical protein
MKIIEMKSLIFTMFIADFGNKENTESCKVLDKDNVNLLKQLLALIENNGIDFKILARNFPNHLAVLETENTILKTNLHEFDDIVINKTAKKTEL